MKLLKLVLLILFVLLVLLGWIYPSAKAEGKSLLLSPDCPECCQKVNHYQGINANDLMRVKYIVKYTKFARDQESEGYFILVDNKGFKRSRK